MTGHNYYILSALPGLGEFGSEPLISTTELLEYAENIPGLCYMLEIIFLSDDLLQYQAFDIDYFRHGVEVLNPGLMFLPVSAQTGEGFDAWTDWLRAAIQQNKDKSA